MFLIQNSIDDILKMLHKSDSAGSAIIQRSMFSVRCSIFNNQMADTKTQDPAPQNQP
jgi:hypothetical protein